MQTKRTAAAMAVVLGLLAGQPVPAQDAEDDAEEQPPETAEAEESATDDAELLDDPELDAQGFDPNADDDFVPSEEIPADEPIAFPTDI